MKKDHVALVCGVGRQAIRQITSKLCDEEEGNLHKRRKAERKSAFLDVYSVLKSELLNDPTFEWTHDSRLWVHQMLGYNVPGGKLLRGLSVMDCCKSLKEDKELSEEEVFDANVLGWCTEWVVGELIARIYLG